MPDQHVSDEHAATLGFSLHGEVTLGLLIDALGRFAKVLDALSESYNEDVEWAIADLRAGSATATVCPTPHGAAPHLARAMREDYVDAALSIQSGSIDAASPVHMSMQTLLGLVDSGRSMTIASNGRLVEIDMPVPTTEPQEPQTYTTLGSVRGHVDTLSRHSGLSFRLHELSTGKAVKCSMKKGSELVMPRYGATSQMSRVQSLGKEAQTDLYLLLRLRASRRWSLAIQTAGGALAASSEARLHRRF